MSTSAPLPSDHPLMLAWNAHKATEEYANARTWAKYEEHVDGSMWAAFMAGWYAALQSKIDVRPGDGVIQLRPGPACTPT